MTQDSPSPQDLRVGNGVSSASSTTFSSTAPFPTSETTYTTTTDMTTASVSKIVSQPRSLAEVCAALRAKLLAFLALQSDDETVQGTQRRARDAIEVIEEALDRYRPQEISLSYNGGKDCLVLLILILACWPAKVQPKETLPRLQCIYIAPPDPFQQVDDFVATTTEEYHLDLARYALPMRQALDVYLDEKPHVKAVFMGTRRTDPHSEFLTSFTPTDKGWPQFMRINPVLDWHYVEIWTFIRQLDIPFCSLYSQGFSSLGGTKDTRPNPALALDAEGNKFRPAYELTRDDEERLGRDR
ncbi:3'-phosphoadenosine 5'-phosphosulfate sulfotransferase [Neurospora sp. IMI 360204]|nr:3'-phosphoadenosine 5'-phosphosulfate sulfotransferase [Neurospora sp. IMI 360204]